MSNKSYSIYISAFTGKSMDDGIKVLSKNFNIANENAKIILENIPILFMNNLNRKEIRTLKSKLMAISKYGIEFTISSEILPVLAKVSYKTDGQIEGISSNWFNYAFSCPHCNKLILLQPHTSYASTLEEESPKLRESVIKKQSVGTPIKTPVAAQLKSEDPTAVLELQEEHQGQINVEPQIDIEPTIGIGEQQISEQNIEQIQTEVDVTSTPVDAVAEEQPAEQTLEQENIAADTEQITTESQDYQQELVEPTAESDVIEIKEDMEEPQIIQLEEEQTGTSHTEGKPIEAPVNTIDTAVKPETNVGQQDTPVILEETVQPQETAEYTGPKYRVFISNVTGEEKKEQAAQLIAELTGCSFEEAAEKMKKIVVTVFHEAMEEQANDAIAKFKELKIRATKTKIKS